MKGVLFFNTDGIVEQRTTKILEFKLGDFPDFNAYYEIEDYIILYKTLSTILNKTNIPFINETFNGNILIIKYKNDKIQNLTVEKFIKLIISKNIKTETDLSDADSDPLDESCNLYGNC